MSTSIDLSIITATHQRPKHLALCLAQVRQQSLGSLRVEHVVVCDGPDPQTRFQATHANARCIELPQALGRWGAGAKDAGLAAAVGTYVCFWDDDNHYEPHAATTLFAAAVGYDIGVVPISGAEARSARPRATPPPLGRRTAVRRHRHDELLCPPRTGVLGTLDG